MKKSFGMMLIGLLIFCMLTGCHAVGDKATSMSVIYGVTSLFSLALFAGYFVLIKKKSFWFYVLFGSVFIVNIGYLLLSLSQTLETALIANRIAYFGSAFLPLSMIMIILKVCDLPYKKWVPCLLGVISAVVFLVAASPGYLDIYYKSVTLENVCGVSVLNKEYGSWHCLYLFYLISYFIIMLSIIIHAIDKKKLESVAHVTMLMVAVFVNICVWLLEQLVKIDFEFLSVSYIITELFLICAYLMMQHQDGLISDLQKKLSTVPESSKKSDIEQSPDFAERCEFFASQLPLLTPSERAIYDFYVAGKSTREVMAELNITENTLKFHNKNIYSKLGVSTRKQLLVFAGVIGAKKE